MTILLMEGFDQYTSGAASNAEIKSSNWYTLFGAFSDEQAVATVGRTFMDSGKSLFFTTGNRQVAYDIGSGVTTIGTCFHVMVESLNVSPNPICTFYDSAQGRQITLVLQQTTGILQVFRGNYNGTLLGQSAGSVVSDDVFVHVEVKITFNNTTGSVEVRVNGNSTPVINVTNVDTVNTANVDCRYVALGYSTGGPGTSDMWWDNWYVWDTTGGVNDDFLGERRIETVVANADTATEDWTPSTGVDSYAMVDEIGPDDDTTYLSSGTTTNKTVLSTAAISTTTGSCKAVTILARTTKTDVGAATHKVGLVSNAVEDKSADISPSAAGYLYDSRHVANQNPDGPAAWTLGTADAAQLLIENTT